MKIRISPREWYKMVRMVLSSHGAFSTIDLLWFTASECLSSDPSMRWVIAADSCPIFHSPRSWISFFPSPPAFSPPFIPPKAHFHPFFLVRANFAARSWRKRPIHPFSNLCIVTQIFSNFHELRWTFFSFFFFFFFNFIRMIFLNERKIIYIQRCNRRYFFLFVSGKWRD